MGPLAMAGIQAGSDMLGGFINWAATAQQNKKNREWNKDMAEYAYQMDLEQWNRANEYNTPANQMQRFKEAGLNPHLIYGQGNPGNAVSVSPKYNPPEGKFGLPELRMGDFMGNYMSFKVQQQQIDNLETMRQKTIEETNLKRIEVLMKGMDMKLKPTQIQFLVDKMNKDRTMWQYDLTAAQQKIDLNKERINQIIQQSDLTALQKKKIAMQIKEMEESGVDIWRDPVFVRMMLNFYKGVGGGRFWDFVTGKVKNEGPGPIEWIE